jgi:protein-S-isoprenylcysteine O-methyltransferase Ste14
VLSDKRRGFSPGERNPETRRPRSVARQDQRPVYVPSERLGDLQAVHGRVAEVSLALRNLLFTLIMPGSVGVYVPWLILTASGANPMPVVWPALILTGLGVALYLWCVWHFATFGRGTPGPWDAPGRVVDRGPYGWVRNPMYLAVLLVVAGEALLFLSLPLLIYLGILALVVQLFVVGYEEPTLTERFGDRYIAYRRRVPRWIPRPPRTRAA